MCLEVNLASRVNLEECSQESEVVPEVVLGVPCLPHHQAILKHRSQTHNCDVRIWRLLLHKSSLKREVADGRPLDPAPEVVVEGNQRKKKKATMIALGAKLLQFAVQREQRWHIIIPRVTILNQTSKSNGPFISISN